MENEVGAKIAPWNIWQAVLGFGGRKERKDWARGRLGIGPGREGKLDLGDIDCKDRKLPCFKKSKAMQRFYWPYLTHKCRATLQDVVHRRHTGHIWRLIDNAVIFCIVDDSTLHKEASWCSQAQ